MKKAATARPPQPRRPSNVEELKKSDATRQRVLDAAARVLSVKGFAGTKLSDIADEANLKTATLYYYYASREALVEAVMVTGTEHVRLHTEDMLASLPAELPAIDRLCAAVESHLRFVLEISNYTQAVIRNSGQVPDNIRQSLSAELALYGKLWQGLVDAAAVGSPRFKTASQRRTLHLMILGGLNWTVEWWDPSRTPLEEVVDTAVMMTRATLSDAVAARKAR